MENEPGGPTGEYPLKRSSRSKVSRSKGMVKFKMLKYITLDIINLLLFFKYSLQICGGDFTCSPKSTSFSPLEHKTDDVSLPFLQLGGSHEPEFWPMGYGCK